MEEIDLISALKSIPEWSKKRSSSVEIKASITLDEILEKGTLDLLTCQNFPIIIFEPAASFAIMLDANNSGGLSNIETGGKSFSDCNKYSDEMTARGNKVNTQ
jgi:hypothetical protein